MIKIIPHLISVLSGFLVGYLALSFLGTSVYLVPIAFGFGILHNDFVNKLRRKLK